MAPPQTKEMGAYESQRVIKIKNFISQLIYNFDRGGVISPWYNLRNLSGESYDWSATVFISNEHAYYQVFNKENVYPSNDHYRTLAFPVRFHVPSPVSLVGEFSPYIKVFVL